MDWLIQLFLVEMKTTKKIREKKFWKLLKQDTQVNDPAEHLASFVEGLHSEEDYWIKGYKRWQKTNQKLKDLT